MPDTIDLTVIKLLNLPRPEPAGAPLLLASRHAYKEAQRLGLICAEKQPPPRVCLGDYERRVWTPRPQPSWELPAGDWYLFDRSA